MMTLWLGKMCLLSACMASPVHTTQDTECEGTTELIVTAPHTELGPNKEHL
jgi:hypothetical protein